MKVCILSPYPKVIGEIVAEAGDELSSLEDAEFIVSYGHREILKEPVLSQCPIVNLHISLLPWNRGADPNFRAWFDGTPHGVTLHVVDEGVDTGPVVAQREMQLWTSREDTLATTYARLHATAVSLFAQKWPALRAGKFISTPQSGRATYHRSSDKEPFFSMLSSGWDTPIHEVASLGRSVRARQRK